ncbi:MAG: hypothetical protein ACO1OO_03020 [Flavisolibacter sp.]
MIYESYYWKSELIKLSKKLTKRIRYKRFWTDSQNGAFEKEIMIGFYVIRKLIEAHKVPNELISTKIKGKRYPNKGKIVHLMNNHKFPEYYDFENGKEDKLDLKFLINQIVHSYIFSPNFELNDAGDLELSTIHFCSDDHRNKWIYELTLLNIIELFEKIGNSNVTSASYYFDEQKKDYRTKQSDGIVPIPEDIERIIRQSEDRK